MVGGLALLKECLAPRQCSVFDISTILEDVVDVDVVGEVHPDVLAEMAEKWLPQGVLLEPLVVDQGFSNGARCAHYRVRWCVLWDPRGCKQRRPDARVLASVINRWLNVEISWLEIEHGTRTIGLYVVCQPRWSNLRCCVHWLGHHSLSDILCDAGWGGPRVVVHSSSLTAVVLLYRCVTLFG